MIKIDIIICARYKDCGGGKCFRALRERVGAFSIYPADEPVEIVGYSSCGGCPGGNVEYVPAEFKKNGATAIHLARGWWSAIRHARISVALKPSSKPPMDCRSSSAPIPSRKSTW
jgi:predicted metal-binding protein